MNLGGEFSRAWAIISLMNATVHGFSRNALIFFLLAILSHSVAADPPQFSVGDRVEVDVHMNSDPATGLWKPGVIKQVDLGSGGYWVELDGAPGQDNWKIIPIRTDKWTRSAGPAAAPATTTTTTAPTTTTAGTTNPQTAAAKAPAGDIIEAHKGPHTASPEHIRSMIYEDMMFKHRLEWDEVQMTFSSLSVGGPYVEAAKNQVERNSLAYSRRLGVPVHPVKTNFRVAVRSNLGTEHEYEYDRTYLWYIDTRGECTLTKTGKPIDWKQLR